MLAAALALAGCATTTEIAESPAPPPPVVVDSFCETAKYRPWSIEDSPESIREARAWNRMLARRCPKPATAKKA